MIHYDDFTFKLTYDKRAILTEIDEYINYVQVPSQIFIKDENTGKYINVDVVGIDYHFNFPFFKCSAISFSEHSKIELVRNSFVHLFDDFQLPPKIKRIIFDDLVDYPQRIKQFSNKFLFIDGKGIIFHFHPYEMDTVRFTRKHLHLRETLKIVGPFLFYKNHHIQRAYIPASVEVIGYKSFNMCINMSRVFFRGNSRLEIICEFAFEFSFLKSITLPPSLNKIGDSAFRECKFLEEIIFPADSKLEYIGSECFRLTGLRTVQLPSSIIYINVYSFNECNFLESAIFPINCKQRYISMGLFMKSKLKFIKIPSSIEAIEDSAFEYCEELETVEFSKNSKLRAIYSSAFKGTSIRSISFPSSLETISSFSFTLCKLLEKITFPHDSCLRTISYQAFNTTSVRSVTLPSCAKDIDNNAFDFGCEIKYNNDSLCYVQ